VIVRLVERSLVIWVLRVPPGVAPRSFVGSYGTHQARKISDDEDSTAYLLNVGSFWAVCLKDAPLLVRGSSRGV